MIARKEEGENLRRGERERVDREGEESELEPQRGKREPRGESEMDFGGEVTGGERGPQGTDPTVSGGAGEVPCEHSETEERERPREGERGDEEGPREGERLVEAAEVSPVSHGAAGGAARTCTEMEEGRERAVGRKETREEDPGKDQGGGGSGTMVAASGVFPAAVAGAGGEGGGPAKVESKPGSQGRERKPRLGDPVEGAGAGASGEVTAEDGGPQAGAESPGGGAGGTAASGRTDGTYGRDGSLRGAREEREIPDGEVGSEDGGRVMTTEARGDSGEQPEGPVEEAARGVGLPRFLAAQAKAGYLGAQVISTARASSRLLPEEATTLARVSGLLQEQEASLPRAPGQQLVQPGTDTAPGSQPGSLEVIRVAKESNRHGIKRPLVIRDWPIGLRAWMQPHDGTQPDVGAAGGVSGSNNPASQSLGDPWQR